MIGNRDSHVKIFLKVSIFQKRKVKDYVNLWIILGEIQGRESHHYDKIKEERVFLMIILCKSSYFIIIYFIDIIKYVELNKKILFVYNKSIL